MDAVTCVWQGGVGRVWINRPQVRNAFNEEVVERLTEVFLDAPADARVLVLGGVGKVFSAGADAEVMRRIGTYTWEENKRDAQRLSAMFEALDNLSCVVVGRVQGAAMGGGAGLLACCDVVLAAQESLFAFSEVRLGLVPAVISPYVLRCIGHAYARRYCVTGERFGVEEGMRMGLVHGVCGSEEMLEQEVQRVVQEALHAAPGAVKACKALLRAAHRGVSAEMVESTTSLIATLRGGVEAQEGLGAFIEKRPASWVQP